jgi:hypothetical protein
MSAGHAIQVRVKEDELRDLDEWRRSQSNPPTRGAASKQLASIALRIALQGSRVLGIDHKNG